MATDNNVDAAEGRNVRRRRHERGHAPEDRPSIVVTPPPSPSGYGGVYDPIEPSWGERVRAALQYYGFGIGLLVLTLALAGMAFYVVVMPQLAPEEEDEDLSELAEADLSANARVQAPGTGAEADHVVQIGSMPTGAMLLVDNEPVGLTPVHDLRLRPGYHLVTMMLDGHVRRDTLIEVSVDGPMRYTIGLRPMADLAQGDAAMALPEPATTEARERQQRETRPSQRENPPPAQERATPARSERRTESPRTGRISIVSNPSDAEVLLDSEVIGHTPLTLRNLEPGLYQVSVRKSGFAPATRGVRVTGGSDISTEFSLQQQEGRVTVMVQPWGSIYIDGELVKRDTDVQYSASLSPGSHSIQVRHPVLGVQERIVQIHPDETTYVEFQLNDDN